VGAAVLAVWVTLLLSRSVKWRFDWIELLGIAVGVVWIVMMFEMVFVVIAGGA
jgi:hypothetical protein